MTPILLVGDTVKGFLPDATSCVVTEERNGIFEMELTYPVAGPMFGELAVDRYVKAKPNDTAALQLFRIYEITKPIAGIVTVRCEHVSYALAHYPVTDVSGTGTPTQAVGAVLAKVNVYLTLSHAFHAMETGWATTKAYQYKVGSARAALGGSEGSVLDTFGGEFEWDNYDVKLHQHRGSDTGVVVAYRKNMTDLKVTTSLDSAYTALFPYAIKDDVLVTVTGGKITVTNSSGIADRVLIRDFSSEFQGDEEVNATTLRAKADSYLAENDINAPSVNVSVSFVNLCQSPDYADVSALERVSLCDWVTVRHDILGVDVKAQVIKTEYDCIAERYNRIELGSARANFQDTMQQTIHDVTKLLQSTDTSAITQAYMQAIADATAMITGADGGYVHLIPSQNPQEIVISDVEDYTLSTAKVWRWNKNGLGYSSTGYSGTYTTAITKDGKINASMITTGKLNASLITAGVLQSADADAFFNLENGEIKTYHNYGSYSMAARMQSGRFQLLYNDSEMGGLGTIEGGIPYLFFNNSLASELIIGYGSSGTAYGMISVKTDKTEFYVDQICVGYFDSNGYNGRCKQFEAWYAQSTAGGYAYDYQNIWTAIDGKAESIHNHDGLYIPMSWYSQNTEGGYTYDYNKILTSINGKADSAHSHASDSWFTTALGGKADSGHEHDILGKSTGAAINIGDKNLVNFYKDSTANPNTYKIDVASDTIIDLTDVTVTGLTGYATENHTHSEYAATYHTHSNYLLKSYNQYYYGSAYFFKHTNLSGEYVEDGRLWSYNISSSTSTQPCIGVSVPVGSIITFEIGTTTVAYIDSSGIHNGAFPI